MNSTLTKSVAILLIFWWLVLAIYWGMYDDYHSALSYQRAAAFWPISEPKAHIALFYQLAILRGWSLPLLIAALSSFLLGIVAAAYAAYRLVRSRKERSRSNGEFLGLTVTMGKLPVPRPLPMEISGHPRTFPEVLTEPHRSIVDDVISTLAAHPNAYGGPDAKQPLWEIALENIHQLGDAGADPQAILLSTSRFMGSITSWLQVEGQWEQTKDVCSESARLTALLPSYGFLPEEDRRVLYLAGYFFENCEDLTLFTAQRVEAEAAQALIRRVREIGSYTPVTITPVTTTPTHEKTLSELVWESFNSVLIKARYIESKNTGGAKCLGWKLNGFLYLFEKNLYESMLQELAALALPQFPIDSHYTRPSEMVKLVMSELDQRGLLVREFGANIIKPGSDRVDANGKRKGVVYWTNPVHPASEKRAPVHKSLWKIRSGDGVFPGILAVKMDDVMSEALYSVQDSVHSFFPPIRQDSPEALGDQISASGGRKLGLFKASPNSAPAEVVEVNDATTQLEPSKPELSIQPHEKQLISNSDAVAEAPDRQKKKRNPAVKPDSSRQRPSQGVGSDPTVTVASEESASPESNKPVGPNDTLNADSINAARVERMNQLGQQNGMFSRKREDK